MFKWIADTWPGLSRGLVRGRADMLMLLFSPYLATSLAVDNGAANSQTSSLLPNPHLSRHRSTAEPVSYTHLTLPTTRSSAVMRWRLRWGLSRRLEVCEFAAPLSTASEVARYGENKSINISARPRTNPRERPGHVCIFNSFKHFIFAFFDSY